jgi:hypothetical protein
MAKKATKTAKTTKKKTTAPKAKKKSPAKKASRVEITLDAVETKAFELAHGSNAVCEELENAATSSLSQAVCKVFKKHGISLNTSQSEKVALLLFGD